MFRYLHMLTTRHCPYSPAARHHAPYHNRSISPAGWAHSSKPAAAGLLLWAHIGTDRQTDRRKNTVPFHRHTHTHPFNGPFFWTTWVSRHQKGKTDLDFTEARDSGISWDICKSAPRSRQTTRPAPYHSVFYRPDALPAAQPTASKH